MIREIEKKSEELKGSWVLISILQIPWIIVNLIGGFTFKDTLLGKIGIITNASVGSFLLILCIINSLVKLRIRRILKNKYSHMLYSHDVEDEDYLVGLIVTEKKLLITTFLNFLLLSFLIPLIGLFLELKSNKTLLKLENSRFRREVEFNELLERRFRERGE